MTSVTAPASGIGYPVPLADTGAVRVGAGRSVVLAEAVVAVRASPTVAARVSTPARKDVVHMSVPLGRMEHGRSGRTPTTPGSDCGFTGSSDVDEVLDPWRPVEVRADQAAPRGEPLGGPEVLQVRLDGLPLDQKDEAGRRLHAPGHPYRAAALGARQHLACLAVRGGELVLPPGYHVDESHFQHHAAETSVTPMPPDQGSRGHRQATMCGTSALSPARRSSPPCPAQPAAAPGNRDPLRAATRVGAPGRVAPFPSRRRTGRSESWCAARKAYDSP